MIGQESVSKAEHRAIRVVQRLREGGGSQWTQGRPEGF